MEERLQKALARAGVAARRKSEELIKQGRVTVNGRVVSELGTKIDPESDEVRVDGERVRLDGVPEQTFALYKPRGVVSTTSDELGRRTVLDLLPAARTMRLFPVGRLDAETEGLILLTNNGRLANRLTHPRYEHEKEYRVKVFGVPSDENLERLRKGVPLEEGKTLPARISIERAEDENTWLRVILREGKKRQIRRMFEIIGHPVRRLIRVRMGPIELGALKPGESRELTAEEYDDLAAGRRSPARMTKRTRKPGWAAPKVRTDRTGRPRRRPPRRTTGNVPEGGGSRRSGQPQAKKRKHRTEK
ncbi:MAG: rRNA pseudouridine synthase [Ardenticatenaceae bacterium]|nr:rRNA pseudouridine synthase [Ardenticatenaceae bacterium]